jgi:hypothetical protein
LHAAVQAAAAEMVADMEPALQEAVLQQLLEARAASGQQAMQPSNIIATPMDLDNDQPSHNNVEHDDLYTFDNDNRSGMPPQFTWAKKSRKESTPGGGAGTSSKHISDCPDRIKLPCVACNKRGCKECAGKYCKKCCMEYSIQDQQYHCKAHRAAAHQTPGTLRREGHVVIAIPPQVR